MGQLAIEKNHEQLQSLRKGISKFQILNIEIFYFFCRKMVEIEVFLQRIRSSLFSFRVRTCLCTNPEFNGAFHSNAKWGVPRLAGKKTHTHKMIMLSEGKLFFEIKNEANLC